MRGWSAEPVVDVELCRSAPRTKVRRGDAHPHVGLFERAELTQPLETVGAYEVVAALNEITQSVEEVRHRRAAGVAARVTWRPQHAAEAAQALTRRELDQSLLVTGRRHRS